MERRKEEKRDERLRKGDKSLRSGKEERKTRGESKIYRRGKRDH